MPHAKLDVVPRDVAFALGVGQAREALACLMPMPCISEGQTSARPALFFTSYILPLVPKTNSPFGLGVLALTAFAMIMTSNS